MNNLKTEPMVKHSNQVRKEVSNAFAKVQDYEHAIKSLKGEPVLVHTTTDYFIFKPIEGNRNKNLMHINRLKKSMADNYLFTVIIVNENYEKETLSRHDIFLDYPYPHGDRAFHVSLGCIFCDWQYRKVSWSSL